MFLNLSIHTGFEMITIKAIYRSPAMKSISFILSSHSCGFANPKSPEPHIKRWFECFDQIRQLINRKESKKNLGWTVKIILENDFLESIQKSKQKEEELANPSFRTPVCMELLTINPARNHQCSSEYPYETPKCLDVASSEDIIEVCI